MEFCPLQLSQFGIQQYADMLDQSCKELVKHTIGQGPSSHTNINADKLPSITQFGLLLHPQRGYRPHQGGEPSGEPTLWVKPESSPTMFSDAPGITEPPLEDDLPLCYTTLLQAVPYQVGKVHVGKRSKNPGSYYVVPWKGQLQQTGRQNISPSWYEVAGPRYLNVRYFKRIGPDQYRPSVDLSATRAGRRVLHERRERKEEVGPSASDPCLEFPGDQLRIAAGPFTQES